MNGTEGLAYVALFALAITLLLTNQVALADVAKMIGKIHRHLMRDIARYINDMEPDPKLDSAKFFI